MREYFRDGILELDGIGAFQLKNIRLGMRVIRDGDERMREIRRLGMMKDVRVCESGW